VLVHCPSCKYDCFFVFNRFCLLFAGVSSLFARQLFLYPFAFPKVNEVITSFFLGKYPQPKFGNKTGTLKNRPENCKKTPGHKKQLGNVPALCFFAGLPI